MKEKRITEFRIVLRKNFSSIEKPKDVKASGK